MQDELPAPKATRTPTLLRLPPPEAFGLAGTRPAPAEEINWALTHQRLKQVGATCFQTQRQPDGGYRVTCLVPASEPGRMHHIEAISANEAEAVRSVTAKLEQWSR
jgi:hypothetical protein